MTYRKGKINNKLVPNLFIENRYIEILPKLKKIKIILVKYNIQYFSNKIPSFSENLPFAKYVIGKITHPSIMACGNIKNRNFLNTSYKKKLLFC